MLSLSCWLGLGYLLQLEQRQRMYFNVRHPPNCYNTRERELRGYGRLTRLED